MQEKEKQKSVNQMDMVSGPIASRILLFALPLAASSILQQLFNSADVAVVGRFAGSKAMAAVGSNTPVISLFINLFVGLSVGANVVIAHYIGQKRESKIKEAVHTSVSISLISGFLLLLFGMVLARPILEYIDTPADVLEGAVLYLRIYFGGMPFIMFYNFGAAILRSKGDTKRPLYCLILSGIINVLLNLILVVVFHLGVAGVGIATVMSNVISSLMVLQFLCTEEEPYRLHFKEVCLIKEHVLFMARIGLPAGLQGMVFSLSNVLIQSAINSFGADAIAGSTAAVNFEYFTYYAVSAFAQAVVTFTSQNYGANNKERCKKIYIQAMLMSVIIAAAMNASFLIFSAYFIRFYSKDTSVIYYALARMRDVLTLGFLINSYEITASALRGMGISLLPALITMIGTCLLRFFWVFFIFAGNRNYDLLMAVYPVSWIITGSCMLIAYAVVYRKHLT